MLLKIFYRIKGHYLKGLRSIIVFYFKSLVGNEKYCIISNDCWGGEIYKILDRPFNTPFIGLMLMSPCYIKLLEDPQHYVNLPLHFNKSSKYPIAQKLRNTLNSPIGILGDSGIEIHFLHYESELVAKEKWMKRVQRIDWDNVFIKYDCGKDYADNNSVKKFSELKFPNKLIFGNENFGDTEVFVTKQYSTDALVQFKNCLLEFNPFGWLKGAAKSNNKFDRMMCKLAYKYL